MTEGLVLSASEIAQAVGLSKRGVNKRAKKEGWVAQVVNGKKEKRFAVSDLPEDIRAAVEKAMKDNNRESGSYSSVANAVPRQPGRLQRPIPVGSPELTDWQNQYALARVDLVEAYLKAKRQAKAQGKSRVAAAELFLKGYNTGELYPRLFRILGEVKFSTIEQLCRTWKTSGYDYVALAPQWGLRRGWRKITAEEFNQVLSFALHPNRLRKAEAIRLAKLNLSRRGIETPSSEATLRRALEDWISTNYDRWIFCREGEKALNDKCLPYLERDAGLLDVAEVFVADGHKLNFDILHPETGKPARMNWLCWYDWASCMPAGWCIMPTETAVAVAAGLRRAILNVGKIPTVAYLDNGKAFKAKVFNDSTIDFEELGFNGLFGRLGIETIFAWPYNAQSKPVERFFETFGEMERLMPTYTGTDIAHKPAHLLRNEKLHKKIHEKRYGGWVPTMEEANALIAQWVAEYAQRPHRALKGLCPADVWEAGKGPGVDETALMHLMMATEPKPVHRQGVKLFGRWYYDEALYGIKDRVEVRYDLEDRSRVWIYDKAGTHLICEAGALKKVHPVARVSGGPGDVAEVRAQIRRKRSLKKGTEAAGREYADAAPVLVSIQGGRKEEPQEETRELKPLPRAEAERIEAEAEKMKVLEFTPKREEPIYMSEPDRYEEYLRREFITRSSPWMRWHSCATSRKRSSTGTLRLATRCSWRSGRWSRKKRGAGTVEVVDPVWL